MYAFLSSECDKFQCSVYMLLYMSFSSHSIAFHLEPKEKKPCVFPCVPLSNSFHIHFIFSPSILTQYSK